MDYEIEIVDVAPLQALVIETECAPYDFGTVLGSSFGRIHQHIVGRGQEPAGMPFMRYLSMSDTSFRIQAGMPSELDGEGDIVAVELPGGKLATTLYLGPYGDVGAAWDAMQAWAEAEGVGRGVMGGWDVYENDPDTVADESELRTRLYLPVS